MRNETNELYRIWNTAGEVMFTARVIPHVKLRTCVVHVLYRDIVIVVCHLIGPENLPSPAQVCLQIIFK